MGNYSPGPRTEVDCFRLNQFFFEIGFLSKHFSTVPNLDKRLRTECFLLKTIKLDDLSSAPKMKIINNYSPKVEVNGTWLITSELANARKVLLFTCLVYTNEAYKKVFF